MKPLLGLAMIVKNEAHGIRETLESLKPFIDYWTLVDTGSTDGTQETILEILGDQPGELFEEPFVDFATSRNRALELHGERTAYVIMPDSDDRLVNGAALRGFLENRDGAGFMVNLRRGELSYYLPLVMKTEAGWRYHGAVHEYSGPTKGGFIFSSEKIPGVRLTQDPKPQSKEASRKRWERDLGLLLKQCSENPTDSRGHFYLAQTYECLGDSKEALNVYEERIAMGGWIEETFEAYLRRAKIMQASGYFPWLEIQSAYLQAYACDPRRAEPLFKIAEFWYAQQNHAMAFLFASRAAELPRPDSTLFVDEEVYTWKAADIAAISGFYTKDAEAKTRGLKFAERCVRAQPNDERIRANRMFYAPSATEMFTGYASKRIDFTPEAPYSAINPSVYYDGWWRCIIRTVNYKIVNGHYTTPNGSAIYTRNFMLELLDGLDVDRAHEMIDKTGIQRSAYPVHGFEDCRLFKHQGRLHFTATVCDFDLENTDGPREIVLGALDLDYAITKATPIRGPWSEHPQKNWMPRSGSNGFTAQNADLIYALRETEVSVINLGDAVFSGPGFSYTTTGDLTHGRLRGGSQLIAVPGGYLCVVHDVSWPGNNTRVYLHRFVLLSDAYKIISMTDPFYFQKRGIEFCAGLAYDGRKLVASFGVDDSSAHFGIFSLESVMRALRADFQI